MSYSNLPPGPPPDAPAHPAPEVLHVYGAGDLDPATAVSVEVHLERCAHCRAMVNEAASDARRARLDANWFMIAAELDAPKRGVVERAVTRVGLPRDVARLMAATPSLRRSWFVAVLAALLLGIAASNPDRPGGSILLFLALAPLVPVLGVALAYGPGVDPAHEITVATPLSGFRLLLVRTVAVLATSLALAGVASLLLLRREGAIVLAWFVPGLALSLVCLALTTWLRPKVVAWVVSCSWLAVVVLVSDRTTDRLELFHGAGQLAMLVLGLAALAVVVGRRKTFDVAAAEQLP